jgi:predicted RNase H-like HicB family nuclease
VQLWYTPAMSENILADTIRLTKQGITYQLDPAAEGGYVITVVDYPSCATQGETIDEALSYAEDALLGCLTVDQESGLALPEILQTWMTWAQQTYEQKDQEPSPARTDPAA